MRSFDRIRFGQLDYSSRTVLMMEGVHSVSSSYRLGGHRQALSHGLDHATLPPQLTVELVKLSEESCVWPNISMLADLECKLQIKI